jgi:hypothetical protein
MADCDMTAVVHISSFYERVGCGFEPKAGDLIQLTEYGADRPGGRSAPIYEITERDDEYLPMTNPLIGHYVWYIKCKRFEYSYEPGIPSGPNNKQINDGGDYGRLAFGENPEEVFQPYPDSVQNSAKCIYDYYSEDPSGLDLNANHYVPPNPPSCPPEFSATGLSAVPGPYTPDDPVALATLLQSITGIAVNASSIIPDVVLAPDDDEHELAYHSHVNTLLSILANSPTLSSPAVDTFVAGTSGNPDDIITYTAENDDPINLNIKDGGYM